MLREVYVWLRYNVFITNVATEKLDGKAIADAYKIRWQIEILFKSWKSAGNLQQILHEGCTNICRDELPRGKPTGYLRTTSTDCYISSDTPFSSLIFNILPDYFLCSIFSYRIDIVATCPNISSP